MLSECLNEVFKRDVIYVSETSVGAPQVNQKAEPTERSEPFCEPNEGGSQR